MELLRSPLRGGAAADIRAAYADQALAAVTASAGILSLLLYVVFAASLAPRLRRPGAALAAAIAGPALALARDRRERAAGARRRRRAVRCRGPVRVRRRSSRCDCSPARSWRSSCSASGARTSLPRRLSRAASVDRVAARPHAAGGRRGRARAAGGGAGRLRRPCAVDLAREPLACRRRRRDARRARPPRGVPDARRRGGPGRRGAPDRAAGDGRLLRVGPRPRVAGGVRGRRLRRFGRGLRRRRCARRGARRGRSSRRPWCSRSASSSSPSSTSRRSTSGGCRRGPGWSCSPASRWRRARCCSPAAAPEPEHGVALPRWTRALLAAVALALRRGRRRALDRPAPGSRRWAAASRAAGP